MKKKIVLVGGGGHCKSCMDVIEQCDKYTIAGFIDKSANKGTQLMGYPCLGSDADIPELSRRFSGFLIAMGQIKSSRKRAELFMKVKQAGGRLPVMISPCAYRSMHATIGDGTILMHKVVVNADAGIGENCIINTGAVIEHDVRVGSHTHVSTEAVLNGGVKVKSHTFVGSRVMVREGVSIGEHVILSAGISVFKDVPDGMVLKVSWK
jgi:sugar O-acyltransferase (sialic acid O-acetyltransferase NeuD family)